MDMDMGMCIIIYFSISLISLFLSIWWDWINNIYQQYECDIQYHVCASLIWPYVLGRFIIRGCYRVIFEKKFE